MQLKCALGHPGPKRARHEQYTLSCLLPRRICFFVQSIDTLFWRLYPRFKDDVAMMASKGLKHYRFSISWPRIVPTGMIADGVNQEVQQTFMLLYLHRLRYSLLSLKWFPCVLVTEVICMVCGIFRVVSILMK